MHLKANNLALVLYWRMREHPVIKVGVGLHVTVQSLGGVRWKHGVDSSPKVAVGERDVLPITEHPLLHQIQVRSHRV